MSNFTILMANYNGGKYIQQAINSVLNQTFEDWELIIIDDGSTDNSIRIIKKYLKDDRIKLIFNKENLGYGKSLYIASHYISSKYFGNLDVDDILLLNAIEIMHEAHLIYPNASMIYSQFNICDKNMKFIKRGYCDYIPNGITNLEANKVSHFRTYKLNYYNQTEGFHQILQSAIDKDISYKMEEVGDLIFINKVLYLYRRNKQGISQRNNRDKAEMNMRIAQQEARERRKGEDIK
jgi:glycosyltransferase involved in cell wall biosynthesis